MNYVHNGKTISLVRATMWKKKKKNGGGPFLCKEEEKNVSFGLAHTTKIEISNGGQKCLSPPKSAFPFATILLNRC